MLLERRAYALRPGTVPAFWESQLARGITEDVRPIMGRVIGWFETLSGPAPQIVHLWRYDNFDDWFTRLFTKSPAAERYYGLVRPLMFAQENRFMLPAPLAPLTPLWGNGNDWLPGGPVQGDLTTHPNLLVEEVTTLLQPGSQQHYWDSYAAHGLHASGLAQKHLLGCMATLVGQQNQIMHYRLYPDFATRLAHHVALASDPQWQVFTEAVRPKVMAEEVLLLKPGPLPGCTPLLRHPA